VPVLVDGSGVSVNNNDSVRSFRESFNVTSTQIPHLVGAQLCRLSLVNARNVALKPVMGK